MLVRVFRISYFVVCSRSSKCRILALDINDDKVGIAFARFEGKDTVTIPILTVPRIQPTLTSVGNPIKLKPAEKKLLIRQNLEAKRKCDENVAEIVRDIVNEHEVGAFVVGWPMSKIGRMGADAGKVLFLLDYFADDHAGILNKKRPASLWLKKSDHELPGNISDEYSADLILQDYLEEMGMKDRPRSKNIIDSSNIRRTEHDVSERDAYVEIDDLQGKINI